MFTLGFEKIADNAASGGSNNQGLGFSTTDNFNTTAQVGAGGAADEAPQPYEATGRTPKGKPPPKRMSDKEVALFLTQSKVASKITDKKLDNSSSTDGVTTALKYDSTSPDMEQDEVTSKAKQEKSRYRGYVRASLK